MYIIIMILTYDSLQGDCRAYMPSCTGARQTGELWSCWAQQDDLPLLTVPQHVAWVDDFVDFVNEHDALLLSNTNLCSSRRGQKRHKGADSKPSGKHTAVSRALSTVCPFHSFALVFSLSLAPSFSAPSPSLNPYFSSVLLPLSLPPPSHSVFSFSY